MNEEWAQQMQGILRKYQHAKSSKLLLMIDFVTVRDYLFLLKEISVILSRVGERALFYLAAAVSDFFIPEKKMVTLML